MLFNLTPQMIIVNLIVLGIGMTVHEFAHNYVGWRMGDPVPQQQGRLTLNPFVHINWIGWLMFAIIGFGILGSAPISPYRMRDPRWGYLAAVAAGPFSNLGLAIISGLIFRIIGIGTYAQLPEILQLLLIQMVFLNLLLFVFNLLPFFPIDGWHMMRTLLPGYGLERQQVPEVVRTNVRPLANFLMRPSSTWEVWQQVSYYVFLGFLFLSFAAYYVPGLPNIFSLIIGQPVATLSRLIMGY